MAGEIIIHGKVIAYSQGFGDGMSLLLQREAATKWESGNPDRIILPLEVPPWTAKTLKAPSPGDWVDVEVRLMGREYKGKHYLSASVVAISHASTQEDDAAPAASQAAPAPTPAAKRAQQPSPADEQGAGAGTLVDAYDMPF